MAVFNRIGDIGKAVDAVDSEILGAGQVLIAGMHSTTGRGDPEQGQPFGQGATRFSGAGETVGSAIPGEEWHGGGAEAYTAANRRQADRSASLAALDCGVQMVIAREAHQIAYHRGTLEDQANYLGDLSHLTRSISLVPGVGKAAKTAVELAAVNAALGVGTVELHQLSREVDENAAQLHALADEYASLADEPSTPPDFGAEPAHPSRDFGEDGAAEPDPDDRPAPGHPTPALGGAPPGAPAAGAPAPAADAVAHQPVTPGEPAAPAAMPTEAMSGMASAFGAVGGMIGSVVAPLAAVLTGVAGAAGQSLSTLTSGDLAAGTETGELPDDDGDDSTAHEDADDDRAGEEDTAVVDAPVPAATAAESEVADPPPPDKLDPQRPSAPPAATRPPQ